MGSLRREIGGLQAFAAGGAYSIEFTPPKNIILEAIEFYSYGTHTTLITTAQTDGDVHFINRPSVFVSRRGRPPVFSNALARDLKNITSALNGFVAANTVTLADAGAHYSYFEISFIPPKGRTLHPNEWGIDSGEIDKPIRIEGTWGAAADIGVGATAISNTTRVVLRYRRRKSASAGPLKALCYGANFFSTESGIETNWFEVASGDIEALYALSVRQHDNSATAAQMVNGLISRIAVEHTEEGNLVEPWTYWMQYKKSCDHDTFSDAAGVVAGYALNRLSRGALLTELPDMRGQKLRIKFDLATAQPNEVTSVAPATADGMGVVAIGVQFNEQAASRVGV